MTNPLLTPFSLPPFSKILPEHVVPAVTQSLENCRAAVENVVAQGAPYTWENLCQPLAEVDDVLGRIFSPVSHLNSVKKQPGAARSLRTDPAAALRVQHLGRPARGALQSLPRPARRRPLCRTEHGAEKIG